MGVAWGRGGVRSKRKFDSSAGEREREIEQA